MYPKSKKYVAVTRETTKEDLDALYEDLRNYGRFTGLFWIMSPEPAPPSLPIKTIQEIVYSEEFLQIEGIEDQLAFLIDATKVGQEIIVDISNATNGQRDNPTWHILRKGRLTASNFGDVLQAKRVTPSLIKRLLGDYDLSKVKAVTWGIHNEEEALKQFEMTTGLTVQSTGLWLDSSGIIGASPDGLIGNNCILEIKCPYTHRNNLISEALEHSDFYLTKEDDKITLKKDHKYWHQIQGQLFLTNRMFCYFVVWTSKDFLSITIKRDEGWSDNIEVLKDFYYHKLFPKIVEGEL